MTFEERFKLYEDLYSLVTNYHRERGDVNRVDAALWQEKLLVRQKQVTAFQAMDV